MTGGRALRPLARAWFGLAAVLHRVTSFVVLAVIFYAVIAPMGVVLRGLGKAPLALAKDQTLSSYWVARTPPGPAPGSLTRQF